MTARVSNPFPLFLDRRGLPLDGGTLFIGSAGDDPEDSPVDVFLDDALTIGVTQPISVIGGMTAYEGNPVLLYIAADTYSLRTRDTTGAESLFVANAVIDNVSYQPLDSDLTAIAALGTTAYGRALLALADAAALRTAAGIVDSLPLAGGTMTGVIVRGSAGAFPYMADAAFTQARIFVTANGAADPTSLDGDIWLEKAP